jgi:hypothetical protein
VLPLNFVKKKALLKKIVAALTAEKEASMTAARAAHAEATHEQNRADNKYDTRGLEASYLARGQSRQVAEAALAIERFEMLPLKDFGPADPIDLAAFVELSSKSGSSYYFIGPCSGGTEVTQDKKEVLVITPQSPLGQQLVGKKQGDKLQIEIAGSRSEYRVVSVL